MPFICYDKIYCILSCLFDCILAGAIVTRPTAYLRGQIELERLAGGLVSLVKVAEGGWKTVHLRGLGRKGVGSDSGPGSSEYFN